MKLPRAAMMAIGLLLAQQAQAASFVTLGGEPVADTRSVIQIGAPASTVVDSAVSAPPPDRSIETSALPPAGRAEPAAERTPDPRYVVAWPPKLSRSMVAFGEPVPVEPRRIVMAARAPLSLPAVFRGGLAGDAFKSAPTPARAAVEQPVEEPRKPAGRAPRPETSTVAERKDAAPPKRDEAPAPAAPPSVPATPPPTMRLE